MMKNGRNIAKFLSLALFMAALSGISLAQNKIAKIDALIRSFEAREIEELFEFSPPFDLY